MFVVPGTSSSDEESKQDLILQRKILRQSSDICSLPDDKFEQIISKILDETLSVLESLICPIWIQLKMTEENKREAKLHFYTKTGFPGVIGCVDGTHTKIVAPNKDDQHLYFKRKVYFSLNALVVCDHKMRIRFLDARYTGSAHDSLIWNVSAAKTYLKENYDAGDRNCWLLDDAGYPLEPYLMTPYRSAVGGSAEAMYNTKHAKARIIVERAISVSKSRFRCLLGARQLHYKPSKATKIVNVCAALNNICIEYGANFVIEETGNTENSHHDNEDNETETSYSTEASGIRNQIKACFV